MLVGVIASIIPGIGDAIAVGEAVAEPSTANIAAAAAGFIPVAGDAAGGAIKAGSSFVETTTKGAAGGDRAGKAFTPAGRAQVKAENAAMHGGQTTCVNCGQATVPGQQSRAGATPPRNETHVDHIIPKSKGGNGSSDNGQILCRECNIRNGNK